MPMFISNTKLLYTVRPSHFSTADHLQENMMKSITVRISVSVEQASKVEQETREQLSSRVWFEQQPG